MVEEANANIQSMYIVQSNVPIVQPVPYQQQQQPSAPYYDSYQNQQPTIYGTAPVNPASL